MFLRETIERRQSQPRALNGSRMHGNKKHAAEVIDPTVFSLQLEIYDG